MIYDITHVTTYSYGASVAYARCSMRLTPRAESGQSVLESRIDCEPAPAATAKRICFFANGVTQVTIDRPHKTLRFVAKARVDVRRPPPPVALSHETLAAARAEAAAASTFGASSPAHFLFPSPRAPFFAPATDYARASFESQPTALKGAVDLMRRIRNDFRYDPDATKVSTPLSEAFERRCGVCQDFAHIMIAALRGLGLPAAYVSGYIRTIPPPGQERLEGADATHAWVRVWLGERLGWVDLDPTNALVVRDDHVVLAQGRDYSDVAPVDGILLGSGEQTIKVSVDMVALEEDDAGQRRKS